MKNKMKIAIKTKSNLPVISSHTQAFEAVTLLERCRSFPGLGIHQDRHRSVVDQAHLHVRAELAGLDRLPQVLREASNELFVKRNGNFRSGGSGVGRPITLLRADAVDISNRRLILPDNEEKHTAGRNVGAVQF